MLRTSMKIRSSSFMKDWSECKYYSETIRDTRVQRKEHTRHVLYLCRRRRCMCARLACTCLMKTEVLMTSGIWGLVQRSVWDTESRYWEVICEQHWKLNTYSQPHETPWWWSVIGALLFTLAGSWYRVVLGGWPVAGCQCAQLLIMEV